MNTFHTLDCPPVSVGVNQLHLASGSNPAIPLDWPLMVNNVTRSDLDQLIAHLQQSNPRLTHGPAVRAFEKEWAAWTGTKYCVMLNSGASANELTMLALRTLKGDGEVIVPPLTWVSDIASVIRAGLTPVFADVDQTTLGMDTEEILKKITPRTRAVFLTHILGYNALTCRLLDELARLGIPLIEDVCESHGATFEGRRCGSWGWASNFSFYYAHHLSTIEGGCVCTNDELMYETVRMMRSHGMTREIDNPAMRANWAARHPDLNPDFIFAHAAFNMRATELQGVLGLAQLPRLDANNKKRGENLRAFLTGLDSARFFTEFDQNGSSNYAFTLILRQPDFALRDRIETALRGAAVEFRRGTSGGGNQLRQPYMRQRFPNISPQDYPRVDHIHFFGWYIGNYPDLDATLIPRLCALVNAA
jgi:CDP-6-deoxy-D-xylo-4-hexulose-3-dehydrase